MFASSAVFCVRDPLSPSPSCVYLCILTTTTTTTNTTTTIFKQFVKHSITSGKEFIPKDNLHILHIHSAARAAGTSHCSCSPQGF
jgi:hypothetical protein